MIQDSVGLRVTVFVVIIVLLFGGGFAAAWSWRGARATADLDAYKALENGKVEATRQQVKAVEKADTKNTVASTARVDKIEAQRQPEVRYVTQQIIKYRDRPVATRCTIPVDWVRIYNASGTGKTGGVPDAPAAGPTPDGGAGGVSGAAGRGNQRP